MASILESSDVRKPWITTPLVKSKPLSKIAGCQIYLKLENLQPGTSFKSRGVGNFMRSYVQSARSNSPSNSQSSTTPAKQALLHFYISSGGNAGLACVEAASSLGYKATVVLPTSTEEAMVLRLRAAGAYQVISHGVSWAFADKHLREVVMPSAEQNGEEAVYVPPFDHPRVWEGNSTIVDEIKEQLQDQLQDGDQNNIAPDAIICSVGGGGLFTGITQGIDRAGWQATTQVLAIETKGADSLSQSLAQKKLVTLDAITSIATSLGAVRVAEQAFIQAQRPTVTSIVLEDAEAAMACVRFADDERILVEPSCGVSLALAYDPNKLRDKLKAKNITLSKDSKVVIVVCGGCRVSLKDLDDWKVKYADRAKELELESTSISASASVKHDEMIPSSVTVTV